MKYSHLQCTDKLGSVYTLLYNLWKIRSSMTPTNGIDYANQNPD